MAEEHKYLGKALRNYYARVTHPSFTLQLADDVQVPKYHSIVDWIPKPLTKEVSSRRLYQKSEEILIYVNKRKVCSTPIESLFVHYGTPAGDVKFRSLKSSLTECLDSFVVGDQIFFETCSSQSNEESLMFTLPLVRHDDTYNIIKDTIYFFCVENVKNKLVTIQWSQKKALQVFCKADSLIFHSHHNTALVNVSNGEDTLLLHSYRDVSYSDAVRTFDLVQTQETCNWMDQVIADGIPVIISGKSGSGKSTIVHRYYQSTGIPLVTYYCSASSSRDELWGNKQDGIFAEAFLHGKTLLLEGITFLPGALLNEIMECVSKRMMAGLAMHPDFRLIGTHNTESAPLDLRTTSFFRVINLDDSSNIELVRDVLTPLFETEDKINQILSLHDESNTPRDCFNVWKLASIISTKDRVNAFQSAIHMVYNVNMDKFPVINLPVKLTADYLDRDWWNRVSTQILHCLDAKCHVLLVAETEWIARKYCAAIQDDRMEGASLLYCSSRMSTEPLLGRFAMVDDGGSGNDNSIRFYSSSFIEAATSGSVCKMFSIDLLPSAVANRMLPFLEKSKSNQPMEIDLFERKENPSLELSPDFIVVATTSEEGLKSMMPALRNRFVVIRVEREDPSRFEKNVDVDVEAEFGKYKELVEGKADDTIMRKRLYRRISYLDSVVGIKEFDDKIDDIVNERPLDEWKELAHKIPCINQLLYSLLQNRTTVLYGPKSSEKQRVVEELVKTCNMELNTKTVYLSKDTDFCSLAGFTDADGTRYPGILKTVMENNSLLIFENAENLSSDLFECLQPVLDPLVSTYWNENESYNIDDNFRVLFMVTGEDPLPFSFPSYIPRIKIGEMSKEIVKSLCGLDANKDTKDTTPQDNSKGDSSIYNNDFMEHFIDYAFNRIPVSEFFMFRDLSFENAAFKICVALYADRKDRVHLIENMLGSWNTNDDNLKKLIQDTLEALRSAEIRVEKYMDSSSKLHRGQFSTICSISQEVLEQESLSVKRVLFSLNSVGWKNREVPILLVGDNEAVSHVTQLLDSSRIQIDCQRSTSYFDLAGNNDCLSANLIKSITRDQTSLVVFQNLDMLNEHMRSRLYTLLFHKKDVEKEAARTSLLSSCLEYRLGMVEDNEMFTQIFCPPLYPQLKDRYKFNTTVDCPMRVLEKADLIKEYIQNHETIAPLFIMCMESDLINRDELLNCYRGNNAFDGLVWYFSEWNVQCDMDMLSMLFTPIVTDLVDANLNDSEYRQADVQTYITLFMAHQCKIPLVVELERGMMIDRAISCYCNRNEYNVDPFMWYKDTTEKEFIEFLSSRRNRPTLLFLQRLDSASMNMQKRVYNILYQWRNNKSIIINKEKIDISPDTFFVCSTQTHSLYSSFYDLCLVHRGVHYSKAEINSFVSESLTDILNSLKNKSYSFSLVDINKLELVVNPGLGERYFIWLLIACTKSQAERRALEAMMGYREVEDVRIVRSENGCIVKGIFDIPVQCNPESEFDEWSWTTTERDTLFKILAAMLSWRFSLMLVGDRFSGRTFVISMLAKMEHKELLIISLNRESSIADLKGTVFVSREEGIWSPEETTLEQALASGSWVFIQGIEKASSEVSEYITRLCVEQINVTMRGGANNIQGSLYGNKPKFYPGSRIFFSVSREAAEGLYLSELSLCIFCDSIATPMDVQELYLLENHQGNPSMFGEEEAKQFEKCSFVAYSKQPDTFVRAFERRPINNQIVIHEMNLHSDEYKIHNLLTWGDHQLASKFLIKILTDILYFTKEISRSILSILEPARESLHDQFVVVLINIILSMQNSIEDDRNVLLNMLKRWIFVPPFSPSPLPECDLLRSPDMPFVNCFNCSSYELLKMIFLRPGSINELSALLRDDDLIEFTKEVFDYFDEFIKSENYRSDICEISFHALDVIQSEFNSIPQQPDIFFLRPLDFRNWVGESISRVEEAIAKLPGELQRNSHLQSVKNKLLTYRERVQDHILRGVMDSEESQKNAYSKILNAVSKRGSVQKLITDSFPRAMIPYYIAEAIIDCRNEDCEDVYEYNSERNNMIVKTSHLLYKLQCSKNYLFVLGEYSDVLKEYLQIDMIAVLRSFQYISAAVPSLIILLNAVLKKHLYELNWKETVEDYSSYPFYLPQEESEIEIKQSLQKLSDYGFYACDENENPAMTAEDRIAELLRELYEPRRPRKFQLESVRLVRNIDNARALDTLSPRQAVCTDNLWDASFSDEVSSSIVIPPVILRMEKMLYEAMEIEQVNESIIWKPECRLSMKEKLHILCPRRQTLLGRIILDAMENNDLRDTVLEALCQKDTVEKVMDFHIGMLREKFQQEYNPIENELNEKENEIEEVENDLRNRENEAEQLKQSIFDRCENIVMELNNDSVKRMTTLEMCSFMMAVNNLFKENVVSNMNKWLIKQKKMFGAFPFLKEFKPFCIQMIWVSKNVSCRKIMVRAPEGMNEYAKDITIEVNPKVLKQVLDYHNGYIFVLPWAPFRWEFEVDIDPDLIVNYVAGSSAGAAVTGSSAGAPVTGSSAGAPVTGSSAGANPAISASTETNSAESTTSAPRRGFFSFFKRNRPSASANPAVPTTPAPRRGFFSFFKRNRPSAGSNPTGSTPTGSNPTGSTPTGANPTGGDLSQSTAIKRRGTPVSPNPIGPNTSNPTPPIFDPFENATDPHLELYYYPDTTELRTVKYSLFGKCQTDMDMLYLLKLLQCMTYLQSIAKFWYETPDLTESEVIEYYKNLHPAIPTKGHMFFFNDKHFMLFNSVPSSGVGCRFIRNGDDLLPIRKYNHKIYMHWEIYDLLAIPNTLDPIVVVNPEPLIAPLYDDIQSYNQMLDPIKKKKEALATLNKEKNGINIRLQKMGELRDNFIKYYLPKVSRLAAYPNIRLTLHDALFVLFDGQHVSFALPARKEFIAPDNVIGRDGNELWLPLVRTNSLLTVKLTSKDCVVIQKESGFTLMVTEKKDGNNVLNFEVDAQYCGPTVLSASERFTISFHYGREEVSHPVKNAVTTNTAPYRDISRYMNSLNNKDVNQFMYHFSYILSFILCTDQEENKKRLLEIVQNSVENNELCHSLRAEAQVVLQTLDQSHALKWNHKDRVQYQPTTSRFSNMTKMSTVDQFKYIYERRNETNAADRSASRSKMIEIKKIDVISSEKKLPQPILSSIYSLSSQLVIQMKELLRDRRTSTIDIIIDANCSMSRNTRRVRSIVTSVLVTLCVECGFEYHLFVSCGRYKVAEIVNSNQNIEDLYSMIVDLEFLKVVDSSPFDLLSVEGRFKRDDFFFIISDGFCKQLLSGPNEATNALASYPNMYLFFLTQTSKACSREDISHLIEELNRKFDNGKKRFDIDTAMDLLKHAKKLGKLPFTRVADDLNKDCQISPASKLSSPWIDSFPKDWPCTKSMARVYGLGTQNMIGDLLLVSEMDRSVKPVEQNIDLIKIITEQILSNKLGDALYTTLISPPIPSHVVYASKGRSVSYSRYLQSLDDPTVNFFNWSIPTIRPRSAVSIVIDCSSRAFSLLNRQHALFTVFSVLRNLSTMDIACVDVWLAHERTTRVATGISADQLWTNNILDPIYEASLEPYSPTSIAHTIKVAGSTCAVRDLPTVMLVFTNGVMVDKVRNEIQTTIASMKVRAVGIGIGSYLNKFSQFLPEMVWNANPLHLADSILGLQAPDAFDVENGVMEAASENRAMEETSIDEVLKENVVIVHEAEIRDIMKIIV